MPADTNTNTPNPRRYRKLSKPFSSPHHADEELTAFQAGVEALREQHHLANVYVIVQCTATGSDGQEQEYISAMAWGDALRMEALTAWAFGHETARRVEAVAKAVLAGQRFAKTQPTPTKRGATKQEDQ